MTTIFTCGHKAKPDDEGWKIIIHLLLLLSWVAALSLNQIVEQNL